MRSVTLSALLLLCLPAIASSSKPKVTYWNLSYDKRPRSCKPVQKAERELLSHFEERRKTTCTKSDEGDHLLFSCGEIKEVVVFDRESCWMWLDKPLNDSSERRHVAFSGCIKQARPGLGTDSAMLYCACVAPKIAAHSEEELKSFSHEMIESFGRACAASLQIAPKASANWTEKLASSNDQNTTALTQAAVEGAFQTICNTGIVSAQRVLPAHPDAERLLERGYASCVGALARWKKEPGGLRGIEDPVEFVCGYAIGAMFSNYGLRHEVSEQPLSTRVQQAFALCAKELEAQRITSSRLSRQE